jgi:hypothetical protein
VFDPEAPACAVVLFLPLTGLTGEEADARRARDDAGALDAAAQEQEAANSADEAAAATHDADPLAATADAATAAPGGGGFDSSGVKRIADTFGGAAKMVSPGAPPSGAGSSP